MKLWKKLRGESKEEKKKREDKEAREKLIAESRARFKAVPRYRGKIRFNKNTLSCIIDYFYTRELIAYRRVNKLWDDTFEMMYIHRYRCDIH